MKSGLIVAALLGSLLGYFAGGGFFHVIIGYYLFLPLGGLCLLFYFLGTLEDRKQEKRKNPEGKAVAKSLLIAAFVLSVVLTGEGISNYRRYDVENFVEETIPLLDAYREEFGRYPSKLQEVTDRELPYYFQNRRPFDPPYSSGASGFTFSYMPPDHMISGLMLTSSNRQWSRAD